MEVVILSDAEMISPLVADAVEALLRHKPETVLGLATGSSPLSVYDELVQRHGNGLSFASARAFTLDEYVGLPVHHPQSYREVIDREFTSRIDIADDHVHGPDGASDDPAASCKSYEELIRAAGGVDLQLLGVGTDGHIGFNEPGSSLASRTRIKTLLEQTRKDNSRFFNSIDDVPRHVVTQGLGTIMEAAHIVLIATGGQKAQAVRDLVEGPLAAICPASVLQMHEHVTIIVDEAAASGLRLNQYYRETFEHKPVWQGI